MRNALPKVYLILCGAVAFTACSPPERSPPFILTPNQATIHVNETVTLYPSVDQREITSFVSSDTSVASVSSGIVLGLKPGQVSITAYIGMFSSTSTKVAVVP
jgi:Bacterial Ig-like domain (group 2)